MTSTKTYTKTKTKTKTHRHRQRKIQSASKTQCMLYLYDKRRVQGYKILHFIQNFPPKKFPQQFSEARTEKHAIVLPTLFLFIS